MKPALLFVLAGWVLLVAGQGSPGQAANPQSTTQVVSDAAVPSGVRLALRLKDPVSSATAKAGDQVNLELLVDAKDAQGRVVLPRKATLKARVWGAQAHTKEAGARLAILVDGAEWEGHAVQLSAIMSGVPRRAYLPNNVGTTSAPVPGRLPNVVGRTGARYTPEVMANEPDLPEVRAIEGVEIGYLPDAHVTVLVSKAGDINLEKGTLVDFKQHTPRK